MERQMQKKTLTYFRRQGRVGTKKVPDTIFYMSTEANQYKCVSFSTHLHYIFIVVGKKLCPCVKEIVLSGRLVIYSESTEAFFLTLKSSYT